MLYKTNLDEYDAEQIVYLIQLIDDFLLERLELNSENFNTLLEDVVNTAIMQVDFGLLDFIKPYARI